MIYECIVECMYEYIISISLDKGMCGKKILIIMHKAVIPSKSYHFLSRYHYNVGNDFKQCVRVCIKQSD